VTRPHETVNFKDPNSTEIRIKAAATAIAQTEWDIIADTPKSE
jgi:hypothetical protein